MAMSVEAMLTNDAQGDDRGATAAAQADPSSKAEPGYGPKQTLAVERAQQLANLILQEPHRFALQGDRQLQDVSLEALKSVFDLALDTEGPAIPSIAATLHSTFPDDDDESAPTRQKRKRGDGSVDKAQHASRRLFEPTPLSVLTTEGMQAAQLWEQLELRNSKICTLLDAVIVTEQEGAAEEDSDEEEEEDSDEPSASPLDEAERVHKRQRAGQKDEEVAVHNLKQLSDAEIRALGLDPDLVREDDEFEGVDDEDEEDEDEEDYGYPGASDLSDDDEYSGVIVTEPLLSEEDQQKRKAEAEAQERRELRSRRRLAKMMQSIHGVPDDDEDDEDDDADDEDEDEDFEEGDEEDDQEDEDDDEEDEDDEEASSRSSSRSDKSNLNQILSDRIKIRRNAELDDSFFSIDQFNHDTEKYGNEDTSLGDDVDLFESMEREEEAEQDQPLYYADFFAPPPFQASKDEKKASKQASSPAQSGKKDAAVESAEKGEQGLTRSRSSVRFNEEVSVLRIKARRDKEMEITPELLQLLQQQGSGNSNGDDDMEGVDADDFEDDDDEEELDSEMDEEDDEEGEESDSDSEGQRSLMDEEEDEELEVDEQEDELNIDADGKMSFEDASEDSDAERDTARRVAGDLFADDESADGSDRSDEDENGKVSDHQRRVQLLQQEIAQLERENVGKKDWTLMGEAGSRVRPENSLLEEDVEFESNRKAKPVNTPESTQTLEEMIKKRILDDNFDDVVRRANLQPVDFLPSKMLELSDAKNPKSLDQIYEDEMNGTGDEQGAKLDKELQKEHEEIDQLYDQLEAQLDALSNAHFTPKAPKLTVKTISNAPTISLEESLPSTMSHGSQLAPEEVYDAGSRNAAFEGSSSELTPEEKQRRHRQLRDEKRARNERIAQHKRNVEINREAFGQNRGGRFVGGSGGGKKAAAEKDEALKKLIGNKGVSVVGKGDQANGKAGHRQKGQNGAGGGANASHLKL